jgi:hypothetical protein
MTRTPPRKPGANAAVSNNNISNAVVSSATGEKNGGDGKEKKTGETEKKTGEKKNMTDRRQRVDMARALYAQSKSASASGLNNNSSEDVSRREETKAPVVMEQLAVTNFELQMTGLGHYGSGGGNNKYGLKKHQRRPRSGGGGGGGVGGGGAAHAREQGSGGEQECCKRKRTTRC